MAELGRLVCAMTVALWIGGCIQSASIACEDGRVCPSSTVCEETHHLCVIPDQLVSCVGQSDNTACMVNDTPAQCQDQVCLPTACGDGIVTGQEECDGTNLDGKTGCKDLGFYNDGPIACDARCAFDVTQCHGICGDGVLDPDESCDRDQLGANSDCTQLGYYDSHLLSCTAECAYNTTECTGFCGDGIVNGGESCEPGISVPAGGCADYGYDAGRLACSQFCTPSFEACRRIGWHPVVPSDGVGRQGAWALGAADVLFADGDRVERVTAGQRTMTVFANKSVVAVWGASPTQIWGVGQGGWIMKYDGTTWTDVVMGNIASIPGSLYAVWGSSATDVYAVGYAEEVMHYDGVAWTTVTTGLPAFASLTGVWAANANDVVAVGSTGTIVRYNGASWTTEASGGSDLNAVWGSSTTDIFAVGSSGKIMHYNGVGWSAMSSGTTNQLDRVFGRGPNDIYATGENGTILHYDGAAWWQLDSGTTSLLEALAVTPTHTFVAGLGTILEHAGASWWVTTDPNTIIDALADDPDPAQLIAIATACNEMSRLGGGWTTDFDCTGDATAMTRSNGDVFVVTIEGDVSHRHAGVWAETDGVIDAGPEAVWAASPTDVYAVGDAGLIAHFDGLGWTTEQAQTGTFGELFRVWGSGPDDVYAVGFDNNNLGILMHRDATAWSKLVLPVGAPALNGVWGSGPSDIYVVGAAGTILHYNGASWTAMASATPQDLQAVSGRGANDIFAAGAFGEIVHFDGVAWSEINNPAGQQINGVSVGQNLVMFATFNGGMALVRPEAW